MGEYQFPFEKLEVWQDARNLAKAIYQLTKVFPVEERYGLTSQLNRAAISIASNLAEGSGRSSRKDQSHFSQIAYGSLMELACQITIASDIGIVPATQTDSLRQDIRKLANRINALRTSQLTRAST